MGVTAATSLRLSPAQKQFLLDTGRNAMEAAVRKKPPPSRETSDPLLVKPLGAFVTLTMSGELRGCIGFFEPVYPLVDAVARAAVKAALDDHRFMPVRPEEIPMIRLEISVLSGKVRVESAGEIEIGRDGLYLETDTARGLLLPQVATEYRWDADTFVSHVFRKCALPPAPIGTPGVTLYRFTAEVFSETQASPGGRK
jgi:AmmeMemoRadiSam system protein A